MTIMRAKNPNDPMSKFWLIGPKPKCLHINNRYL